MKHFLFVLTLSLFAAAPNDTNYSNQWYLHNTGQSGGTSDADVDAEEAWDLQTGSTNVVVAVLDAGVDYDHPDLEANILLNTSDGPTVNSVDDDGNGYVDDYFGWDFYDSDRDPDDVHPNGHGTRVAGIIGAVTGNSTGVAGISQDVKILVVKFQNSTPVGSVSKAVDAIDYAVARGADIISNSWLMSASWPEGAGFSQDVYDAIERACDAGVLFVATVGNNSNDLDTNLLYPAGYDLECILTVTATDHDDGKPSWATYGDVTVDVGAPGGSVVDYSDTDGIYSTTKNAGYGYAGGTSFATPVVAGIAALLKAQNPTWDGMDIKNRIMSTVEPLAALSTNTVSGGRVNADHALFLPRTARGSRVRVIEGRVQ